ATSADRGPQTQPRNHHHNQHAPDAKTCQPKPRPRHHHARAQSAAKRRRPNFQCDQIPRARPELISAQPGLAEPKKPRLKGCSVPYAESPNIGYNCTASAGEDGLGEDHVARSVQQEGVSNEDASCCRHSCDGDRSPRSGEGEAGAIGAPPASLSVVGATRLLPRLPSE